MSRETPTGPVGKFRSIRVAICDSTNSLAAQYASKGDPGGLWIVADQQNSGRGSRGRHWVSKPGNLFASLLLKEPSAPKFYSQLTFVTSLALREAIMKVGSPNMDVRLKWPNDVLLEGMKCSGILLEGSQYLGVDYVVIGVGVNCAHAPETTPYKATCLAEYGINIEPTAFLMVLSDALADVIAVWDQGAGFQKIRSLWLEHSFGLGTKVSVKIPGKKIKHGVFASVDEAGYMLLECEGGQLERISAADIFFP